MRILFDRAGSGTRRAYFHKADADIPAFDVLYSPGDHHIHDLIYASVTKDRVSLSLKGPSGEIPHSQDHNARDIA